MKFGAFITEINKIIGGILTACSCFLLVFIILHALGIKALDLWLLAGLSLAYGAIYIIFRSPSMASVIANKAHFWPSTILIFFLVITGLSFTIIFFIVTLLAELHLYAINPLLDVSVSLLISAIILTLLVSFLKTREKPSHENIL